MLNKIIEKIFDKYIRNKLESEIRMKLENYDLECKFVKRKKLLDIYIKKRRYKHFTLIYSIPNSRVHFYFCNFEKYEKRLENRIYEYLEKKY